MRSPRGVVGISGCNWLRSARCAGTVLMALVAGLSFTMPPTVVAGSAYRVSDILPGTRPSLVDFTFKPTPLGDTLFFADNNRLWKTDGSHGGTQLVFELDPESVIAKNELVTLEHFIIFSMQDASYGAELWRTDGTAEGTRLIVDIVPGQIGSNPRDLIVFKNVVYFSAANVTHGRELWRTDGTGAGTWLVKDIVPGKDGSNPEPLVGVGDHLLIRTPDSLWSTDGSTMETINIADVEFESWVSYENAVFFPYRGTLWRTDGTVVGTSGAVDVPGSSTTVELVSASEHFMFFMVSRSLLYSSQGTTESTQLLADVRAANSSESKALATVCALRPTATEFLNGISYFGICGDSARPARLWRSDGTPEGTWVVREFAKSTDATPESLFAYEQAIYFSADEGIHGDELWMSDGTTAGTVLVADIHPGFLTSSRPHQSDPGDFYEFGGRLIFAATDGQIGRELRTLENTSVGLFANVRSDKAGSDPGKFFGLCSRVVIQGFENGLPTLWGSDGTASGTERLGKLFFRDFGVNPTNPATGVRDLVVFDRLENTSEADEGELWVTDGTQKGTALLRDIYPGLSQSQPDFYPVSSTSFAFFIADDGPHGKELWATDGTTPGTWLVGDFAPGYAWGAPDEVAILDGTLFITVGGELKVKPLTSRVRSATILDAPFRTTILGAGLTQVFLVGYEEETGFELWVSDGTSAGTHPVKDIRPGPESSLTSPFLVVGDEAFIVADDGTHGEELWRSDGTAEGTFMVADIWPGLIGSSPRELTWVGDDLWFSANDGIHGHEPWKYDGSSRATLVADVRPGRGGSFPMDFHPLPLASDTLFIATDGTHGSELWTSDGTEGGTRLEQDVLVGPRSGALAGFATYSGGVAFAGRDLRAGGELWVLPFSVSRERNNCPASRVNSTQGSWIEAFRGDGVGLQNSH